MKRRRALFAAAAFVASLLLVFVAVELAGRFYAYQVVKRGKLFEADETLGWRVLADLDLVRENADGEPWTIRTDADGSRAPLQFRRDAARRILVIGDSFAFGEGVEIEERFDTRVEALRPELSFVNLGVMGYGTDQELLAARQHSDALEAGDVLLVLTCSNDFLDLLKRSHSARAKPWAELGADGPILHPPDVGPMQHLRDRSYVIASLMARFEDERSGFTTAQLETAGRLYRALLESETRALVERGVRVVIAHHRIDYPRRADLFEVMNRTLSAVCLRRGIECIPLDPVLRADDGVDRFLRDAHWSARGHEAVAGALADYFESP